MLYRTLSKNVVYFVFLFFFVLLSLNSYSRQTKDTSYTDYITINGIAYDVKLRDSGTPNLELFLKGQKIHAHIDSTPVAHGAPPLLVIDSFDTTVTESVIRQLSTDFTEELYASRVINVLLSQIVTNATSMHLLQILQNDASLQQQVRQSYQRIKAKVLMGLAKKQVAAEEAKSEQKVQTLMQGHNRTIDSLVNVIDQVDEENKYGGRFEWVDKDSVGIPIYRTGSAIMIDSGKARFYPQKVVARTFNNFIDMLHVEGMVVTESGKRYRVRCYNPNYSIPLKHIYMRNQYVVFTVPEQIDPDTSKQKQKSFWRYMLNVSDLIAVNAHGNHSTFMVRNEAYALTRTDSIAPYYRRSFYDYLNFTTFLDFLGVMEKTPNSLIQLEGRVRLPLQLTNSKIKVFNRSSFNNVFLPKIDVYLNAAFVNGSQQDSRFGTIYNEAAKSTDMDSLYIDHFDLVRKYNIHTGIEAGFFKKEWKGSNINMYFDYTMRFWRSTLRYAIIDSTALDQQEQFNAWSWTHGPLLRFEYRPDLNIGADFSFGADFRQRILNSDNDNLQVFEVKGPINRNMINKPNVNTISDHHRTNYKLEFNVYYMVNPRRSNGGLYFRVSNYFTYNFKQVFPQILVGYSTRLTGMINNLTNRDSK
jgi:hypothetical protein